MTSTSAFRPSGLPAQLLLLRLHRGGRQAGSPQPRGRGGQGDASALRPWGAGFWFTDAQFIPARRYIEDAKELLRAIKAEGLTGIRWAAYIRADNLDPELAQLMVETGMSYFEIGITSGSQELVRKMRMGYNLRTVLESCRMLADAFRSRVGELLLQRDRREA